MDVSWIIAFLVLGLIFIAVEVVVPGGIVGTLGGLCMAAGCAIAFYRYGLDAGLITTGAAVAALIACLWIEFRLLPKTALGRRMFLHTAVKGVSQAPLAGAEIVGRECVAMTALAPSGVVLIDGKKYEAFSQSGFVEQETRLKVEGMDNFRLIVSKL